MSNIFQFKKQEKDNHGCGEAHCIGCGHKWIAVAPVGTIRFECPECKSMKGHWTFEFAPEVGALMRVCNCGNDLFRLTPDGHMCANCGTYQGYD